jgi:hypothetical protein
VAGIDGLAVDAMNPPDCMGRNTPNSTARVMPSVDDLPAALIAVELVECIGIGGMIACR